MLTGRNILCISVPPWKGEYASTIVELMKVLGRGNRVLYVQNPYTIKDIFSALIRRQKFPYRRAFGMISRIQQFNTGGTGEVYVLVPPVTLTINFLPQGFLYDTLLKINGWLVRRSVTRYLRKLDMNSDLLNIVSFNPILGVVTARKFNEKLLLYHCYDEIKEAAWMKKHGPGFEKKFMAIADAVVVTSKGLLEKKRSFTQNCYLVKNAADIRLFSTAFEPDIPTRHTVGFIGSLDNRIDYDLLVYLVESMPQAHFIFVGRMVDKDGVDRLKKFVNTEFPGSMPLEELPKFVRTFSAGIIPFVKNDFTKGIYPLKINEYLAAGIPVVSTDFSYLDDFSGHISVAKNQEEFRAYLLEEMNTDNFGKKQARQQAASQNTWENRVEQLSAIVKELEAKKTA
jgi:glycosyltransferase involved in cell wall biosynthesis